MMAPKERDLIYRTIRNERIIEDIALYEQDLLAPNQNDQAKIVSVMHFKAMFEPNGVVDIALSSFK